MIRKIRNLFFLATFQALSGFPSSVSPALADDRSPYSFDIKQLPMFGSIDATGVLTGNFSGEGCGEVLAMSRGAKTELLLGRIGKASRTVQGIPNDFPYLDAVAEDMDGDGRTDLVAYHRDRAVWAVAISQGDARFALREFPWQSPQLEARPPIIARGSDGIELFVNAGPEVHILRYSNSQGPFEVYRFGKPRDFLVQGALTGRRDLENFPALAYHVFRDPLSARALSRFGKPYLEGIYLWADFPEPIDSSRTVFGDFNGDGFNDAIAAGWYFGAWWIALGGKSFALEYPANGLDRLETSSEKVIVGDLECDGTDEVLSREVHTGLVQVAHLQINEGLRVGSAGRAVSGGSGPFVCVGYMPITNGSKWGYPTACPDGYAVISSTLDERAIAGSCCRLPEPDMLSSRLSLAKGHCPENSVVTGSLPDSTLRCTEINLQKYRLLPPEHGIHWGFGTIRSREPRNIQKSSVPRALRSALGRRKFQTWTDEGCVGFPWGAVMTGWSKAKCSESVYRQIGRVPSPGTSETVTAIPVFPNCRTDVNPFDPDAGCELENGPHS